MIPKCLYILLLTGIVIILLILQFSKGRLFEKFGNNTAEDKCIEPVIQTIVNTNTQTITVIFPNVVGLRELLFIDYLFWINDFKPFKCSALLASLFIRPYPDPTYIWTTTKNDYTYQIKNDTSEFDWQFIKSILLYVCEQQDELSLEEWFTKQVGIYTSLKYDNDIYKSVPWRQHVKLSEKWKTKNNPFHPLFYEKNIKKINTFLQDLTSLDIKLININFNDNSIFNKNTNTIKTYNDAEVHPINWLSQRDVDIQYQQELKTAPLEKLPLDFNCQRTWNQCNAINYTNAYKPFYSDRDKINPNQKYMNYYQPYLNEGGN